MHLHFTPTELKTLHNSKFFEIKSSATKKIDAMLASVRDTLKEEIEKNNFRFPKEVDTRMGKIFRGENYNGLPYLILDYPKYFSKASVFAFRALFWWGNFFSFTLHLQGKALEKQREKLISRIPSLKKKNIYFCVNDNPWQYHYEKDNYLLIDKIPPARLKQLLKEKKFIKLSRKIPLKDYKTLNKFCKESFFMLHSPLIPQTIPSL